MAQPIRAMARRSAQILLEQIERGGDACHETVPFSLECRESVLVRQEKSE